MEFLNLTMGTHSQISFQSTFFCPRYPIRNPNPSLSKFFLYPSFPLNLSRNFTVSSHFGRPTSRNNYLRKKLTQSQHPQLQQQQVSQNPKIHHPSSNFEIPVDKIGSDGDSNLLLNSTNTSLVNWGTKETKFGAKEDEWDEMGSDEVGVPNVEYNFRNELESFMDQYNADSEFWGIGSGHIFTVYENTEGKVERVDVDEGEILRRNDIEPLLYEVRKVQEFKEVNSKIAHAKYLAREMENGSNVLSKNSSVAKFVNYGGWLGFVSTIQRFTLDKPDLLSKWSIIGLTGLFGLVLVLGWKRLFTAKRGKEGYSRFTAKRRKERYSPFRAKKGKEGYTSKEKEMLRRKVKARMEREKSVKGSVEVIQDFKEPEITEKPQLDKKYLLNAIAKVTGENVNSGSQLLFDTGNSNSIEFDTSKIEEIRRMAQHARDIEKSTSMQGGIDDKDGSQIVCDVSNAKEVIDIESMSLDNHLADHTERRLLLNKQDLMHTIDAFSLNEPFFTPVSESTDFGSEIEGIETRASNVREIEILGSCEGGNSEVEKEKSVKGFSNENQVVLKKSSSSDVPQVDDNTPYPQSSMPEDNHVKSKPRIIKSVKEARDYLSKKQDQ